MANIINQIQVGETPHDIQASAIFYGEVDSTSTSTAYTATIPNLTTLIDGTTIMLRNGVVTSASGFTININGLGAKPVYNNMTTGNDVTPTEPTRDTTIFNINYTMLLIYVESDIVDGGCWICYRGYNSDNNTIGYQLRTNSTAMPTITRTRYYRLLFTSADHTKWVPANTTYDNSATSKKTVNPNAIDPFGRIVYMSGTTNVNAGSNVGATVCWSRYTLALGYSFNTTGKALTLTYPAPVYVQCTPAADGSATMEGYVQSLPNTNDGKIYIFLGMAYSATNIELYDIHPVYYHNGTGICIWTGAQISTKTSDLENDGEDGTSPFATMDDIGSLGGGTITSVKTTAGTHSTINVTSGAANFNVPTKTSHLTNDSGYLTSSDIASVMIYKGTKTAVSALPSTGNTTGDVWHVTADGSEYAWDGSAWQELGTAVDLSNYPTFADVPTSASSNTTGISIADHSTTTITGVQSSTTSVTGVQSSTTTASHVKSGGNGSAPSLGTAFSIPNVTGATNVTVPIKATSATTVPIKATSATTVPIKNASATTIPNVTGVGSGSYTQGTFSGGSLTMTMDTTDTKKLNITFTAATHGADSHTHNPPTLGTDISIIGVQSSTTSVTGVQSSTTSVTGVQSTTTTASKVTLGTAFSVPNITSVGSASNWVFEDVIVPIKNSSATTVPIKNTATTTVVTSKTHTVTDNGHTHGLN